MPETVCPSENRTHSAIQIVNRRVSECVGVVLWVGVLLLLLLLLLLLCKSESKTNFTNNRWFVHNVVHVKTSGHVNARSVARTSECG